MAPNEKNQRWVFNSGVESNQPVLGLNRKILAYCDELMCMEVVLEEGAQVAVHSHPNTQISYIVSGVIEFTVDGEKKIVRKGDTVLLHSNVPHSCVCLEKAMVADFFTPMRDDLV